MKVCPIVFGFLIISINSIQAVEIHNKTTIPAIINQITVMSNDGYNVHDTIKNAHIIINPHQTVELGESFKIVALSLIFNNISYQLHITSTPQNARLSIENDGNIQTSDNITITSQDELISYKKPRTIGPRLI